MIDPFDPRTLEELPQHRVVWLDPACGLFCVVDDVDFLWATQWLWHATPNSRGKKYYATRMTRIRGQQIKIYMHKEILQRTGIVPPSDAHTIGDHQDGQSLHNWRDNLLWATVSENNRRKV